MQLQDGSDTGAWRSLAATFADILMDFSACCSTVWYSQLTGQLMRQIQVSNISEFFLIVPISLIRTCI